MYGHNFQIGHNFLVLKPAKFSSVYFLQYSFCSWSLAAWYQKIVHFITTLVRNLHTIPDLFRVPGRSILFMSLVYREVEERKCSSELQFSFSLNDGAWWINFNLNFTWWKSHYVCQYSKTKEMHFLYSFFLWIKGLYMFRSLFVHLQDSLHKQ
jgi:hypothetical protein